MFDYLFTIEKIEELRKEYKKLVFVHHPDKGGKVEIMQLLNETYEKAFNKLNEKAKGTKEYSKENVMDFMESIEKIINLDNIIIEIVGSWVWVSGETKPHKEALKEAGFKYSGQKIAWYKAPYETSKTRYKKKSFEEIKAFYGVQRVEKTENKKDTKKKITKALKG